MSEAMDKALAKDRDEWFVDYDAEPGIAANAFTRGWDAAQTVSLPDRETIVKAIASVSEHDPDAHDFISPRKAADAVLAALSTQPAAGEVEVRPNRSAAELIAERRSRGLTAADLPHSPSVYADELFPGTLAALDHLSIRPEVQA